MSGERRQITANGGGSSRRPAAAGNGERRQVSAGARSYSVAEAASLTGIPERTLRDWVRTGRIESLPPTPPQRGARLAATTVETLQQNAAADGGEFQQVAAAEHGDRQQVAADGGKPEAPPEPQTTADPAAELRQSFGEVSDSAEVATLRARAEAADQRDRERAAEVEFLRARLVETETAARELRVLLQGSQQQVAALTALLEQPRALAAFVPENGQNWTREMPPAAVRLTEVNAKKGEPGESTGHYRDLVTEAGVVQLQQEPARISFAPTSPEREPQPEPRRWWQVLVRR